MSASIKKLEQKYDKEYREDLDIILSPVPERTHGKYTWVRIFIVLIIALFFISTLTPVKDNLIVLFTSLDANVKQLASNSGMNTHGKALFYSSSPELVDYPTLLLYCPSKDESIEYGCYIPNENKIYILYISDARLAPLMAVTAGHEMLHRAYSNLDSSIRSAVDMRLSPLIEDAVMTEQTKNIIQPYVDAGVSKQDIISELHSFGGTELNLDSNFLDNYYKDYFDDQSKVFAQFNLQKRNIAAIEIELNQDADKINEFKTTIIDRDSKTQSGVLSYVNYLAHNGSLYSYNQNVRIYNSNIDIIQTNIDTYNRLVEAYNKKLSDYQAIFSNLKAQQSVPDAQKL